MLITVKRGNLTLADGTYEVGVVSQGLPFPTKREMEVVKTGGTPGVKTFDRTTRTLDLDFTITRLHDGAAACVVFCATHDELATGRADLTIEFTEDDVTYSLRSLGCAWESITGEPFGLSSDTNYRVVGPPLTATSSEGPVGNVVEGGDGYDVVYGPMPGVLDGGCFGDAGVPSELAVQSPEY